MQVPQFPEQPTPLTISTSLQHLYGTRPVFAVRDEVAKVMFYRRVSVHGGGVPDHPRDQVPPGTRYTPHPGTRYTPQDQVHPPDQVHTPRDQVHPPTTLSPRTRYTPNPSWDQVHPRDTATTGMHSCSPIDLRFA